MLYSLKINVKYRHKMLKIAMHSDIMILLNFLVRSFFYVSYNQSNKI